MGEKGAVMEEKGAVTEEKSADTEQESAIAHAGQRGVFMGRKGAISGTKGAVTGRKGFGLVKGHRLGREGRHFLSEGRQNGRKRRCYGRKGCAATGLKGAIYAQRVAISVPKSVVTAR